MLKTEHVHEKQSSSTYYAGASVGVPFLWESKPGTPIHKTTSSSFYPPLRPPPCYNSMNPSPQKPIKRRSKSFAFTSLFPVKFSICMTGKKSGRRSDYLLTPESLSPSSSSSASSSPVVRPFGIFRRSQSILIRRAKSEFDEEFCDDNSTGSTARCFWN